MTVLHQMHNCRIVLMSSQLLSLMQWDSDVWVFWSEWLVMMSKRQCCHIEFMTWVWRSWYHLNIVCHTTCKGYVRVFVLPSLPQVSEDKYYISHYKKGKFEKIPLWYVTINIKPSLALFLLAMFWSLKGNNLNHRSSRFELTHIDNFLLHWQIIFT